ncbi:MAG: hypothetical protein F6K26_39405 [Moorea sp. SIO2I5]|nr:hypothetical protein [Moorena sp. SIO2I5]
MLQEPQAIRCYQKLTDSLVDLWNRGYSFDELRLYIDGYLSALKHTNTLESYIIYRLEEDATRYLRDPSNFEMVPMPQPETDYF